MLPMGELYGRQILSQSSPFPALQKESDEAAKASQPCTVLAGCKDE